MNILFVCHRFPFPPNEGGKIRAFNIIRHLSQNHSVVVATLAESDNELFHGSDLRGYCDEVIAEVLPPSVRWRQACQALFSSTPSSVAYFRSSSLLKRIQDMSRQSEFDATIVHCAFAAQYVTSLQAGYRYIDFCDLDSGKWFDYSQHKRQPLSLAYGLEAQKLRKYEIAIARHFHSATVSTNGELDEFQTLGVSIPCKVIPNGVDFNYFQQTPVSRQNPSTIIFLGRMDYFPNVDAVLFFAKHILPLIRHRYPQVTLRIIGSNPTREVRHLALTPGISVTGYVPDVRDHLHDAVVSVAPLRIARGTQNKILESMSMGIPVVATSAAAKGVVAIPGKHLLVADGIKAFASKVIEILQDKQLQRQFSINGRQHVETQYAWPVIMNSFDQILTQSDEL